jgi:hypothetical protein
VKKGMLVVAVMLAAGLLAGAGCSGQATRHDAGHAAAVEIPDTRTQLPLPAQAGKEHRTVMLQHLETVQAIVAALAGEDFDLAKGLTEAHLGFFQHRQAMARQQPENFPPAYHDLAMAHHEAAEELAKVMPSRDLKQILPRLNSVLKACVACHLEYKIEECGAR